ncbi:MAG: hypothetical protein ABL967_09180 [Bryobacteraceae bacterium]
MKKWLSLMLLVLSMGAFAHAAEPVANRLSVWMWSDRYVYRPGESLTVRWAGRSNGDTTPYTVFFYRQNNQTGKKYYLPLGTEEVTDVVGKTAGAGFTVLNAGDTPKSVVIGNGGLYPAITIPNEFGMHTIVAEVRDATATRVMKRVYLKISVVSETVDVTGPITSDTTWVNTKNYILRGIVFVKSGATLTIEPGTVVQGAPGSQPPSALVVTREGKINAAGTRSRPIIMTSLQPFGQRTRGDWGGLVLLGKAPINVSANTNNLANPEGTFYIEGLAATSDGLYGGTEPNHNCGNLSYVRVEYAGAILSPNNELNSFTWGGCGKGTTANHLQAIYGLDDSFEWFGGNMDAKYLVGGLSADDFVDFQLGYTGRIQYGVFYQSNSARGNRGIEGDNSEYNNGATPSSNPTMYNLTFIGSGQPGFDEANAPGLFLRRGARASLYNMAVMNFYSSAVELTDANTQAQMDQGNVVMDGVLMWNNNVGTGGGLGITQQISNAATQSFAQGTRGNGNGRNFSVADPKLARLTDLSDPDFRPTVGSPALSIGAVVPPDDGFFDQSAHFIGGMGEENWMEEWTSFLQEPDIAQ